MEIFSENDDCFNNWEDEDDDEFCGYCGGSDDRGHANDCPNNPYGYNYPFDVEVNE